VKEKRVKLPNGIEVLIREPGCLSLKTLFRGLPLLVEASEGRTTDLAGVNDRIDEFYKLAARCVVEPKFVTKLPEECAEGERSLEELDGESLGYLVGQLLILAGVTKEAAAEVGPLSETDAPSSSSTP